MDSLPVLIRDLAMILVVAGVSVLVCKKLGQPAVMGYLIAGMITGPNCNFFPSIQGSVASVWGEIGVIFLMFATGLEFSFYKLKKVGVTAILAATLIVSGMFAIGYNVGLHVLKFHAMDSLFLGAMLSMSSTAIIIKAYEELKLKAERFADLVLGILIIEDMAGIVLMVILTTVAQSGAAASSSGQSIADALGNLVFCLVSWFLAGMFIIPTLFKKFQDLLNEESLLVVCIGLCLTMVVIVSQMGYSSALGAYMMGTLLAETPNSERIEEELKPVKNLFSAIFFVSVGMLVNPALIIDYWQPVLVLVVVTVFGQMFCTTVSILCMGQDLKTSVSAGSSMVQVGEFSFIIAKLGENLKVTSPFLYPVVVAVSFVTIFLTPLCIKSRNLIYDFVLRYAPKALLKGIENYTSNDTSTQAEESVWSKYLRKSAVLIILNCIACAALIIAVVKYGLPLAIDYWGQDIGQSVATILALIVSAPFLWALCPKPRELTMEFRILWLMKKANHLPLIIIVLWRFGLCFTTVYEILTRVGRLSAGLPLAIVALLLVLSFSKLKSAKTWYLDLTTNFLVNLNERHIAAYRQALKDSGQSLHDYDWLDEKFYFLNVRVTSSSEFVGKKLWELDFHRLAGCNIVRAQKGKEVVCLPSAQQIIEADSELLVMGAAESMALLRQYFASVSGSGIEPVGEPQTLREYFAKAKLQDFVLFSHYLTAQSPYADNTLDHVDLRPRYGFFVLGIERGGYTMDNPDLSLMLREGDLLWLLGRNDEVTAEFMRGDEG